MAHPLIPEDPDWIDDAACRTPAGHGVDFFPSDAQGLAAPIAVCAVCPVQVECLYHALDNNIAHGVWGGASERQRRRLPRQRLQRTRQETT